MKNIKQLLDNEKIGLVDIGARGGLEPRWKELESNIDAYLFEPDERSRKEIKHANYIKRIFPIGLGETEGTFKLKLCRDPGVSSLISPRTSFLSSYKNPERFDVIKEIPMKISTLDISFRGLESECDFLKLDTQGTELSILKGGGELLAGRIIGLEIEVEFIRMYESQALFGDICDYLEKYEYEFMDFVNICRWERDKFTLFGQAIFGDALFLRRPEKFAIMLNSLPMEKARLKAIKYISIIALYDHLDLIPVCKKLFNNYLNEGDDKIIESLYKRKLIRRKVTYLLIRIVNRVLKPLGIRTIGMQVS